MQRTQHSFYIPVMGTGFTIDTPLKVAKFGISSAISLVDDVLIEKMRKHHALKSGLPYEPIKEKDYDPRAQRITSYLNLINYLIDRQMEAMQKEPFSGDTDIMRYFRMLPECQLKETFETMMATDDPDHRKKLECYLRGRLNPGRIDVNIMTKVDAVRKRNLNSPVPQPSDAASALRGFALSDLESGVIFSAGLNPRLYQYATEFADFFPSTTGKLKKRIIIKVSDFRSALTQGKYLAKRGLWVSEFRVESGLNCGGHAFSSSGNLFGPILEEFSQRRLELKNTLEPLWRQALEKRQKNHEAPTPDVRICAQGGVGTAEEHEFLKSRFELDQVGWASPFMLVPEVTLVDESHLEKLCQAKQNDIFLSEASPLGIPFWSLKESASENLRRERIVLENPGSPCPKEYAITNTEYTDHPICTASKEYQTLKVKELEEADMMHETRKSLIDRVLAKACICHDLAGAATLKLNLARKAFPAICCGPNLAFFDRKVSLKAMVDHIYGRISIMKANRPHMFINELQIHFDWIGKEIENYRKRISDRPLSFFESFKSQLKEGIDMYRNIAEEMIEEQKEIFMNELHEIEKRLEVLLAPLQEQLA